MRFNILFSSSAGNLYTAESAQTKLLLECGVSIDRIKKALDFKLSGFSGCLVTHEHQDHSKSVEKVMDAGVDVYVSRGTADALGLKHAHNLHIVEHGKQFSIGDLKIIPFSVNHDAAEPLGYLISDGTDKLLFAVDTHYISHTFKGLTMIALELNHCKEMIEHLDPQRKKRLQFSHMSLDGFKDFMRANDLRHVRAIYMLHMSDTNSNPEAFKTEIEGTFGVPVYFKR